MYSDRRIFPELGGTVEEQERLFGLLALILMAGLAFFATQCDGAASALEEAGIVQSADGELESTDVLMTVDDDSAVLTGEVPDTETRDDIYERAVAKYGEDNVTDKLRIEDGLTNEGGRFRIKGEVSKTEKVALGTLGAATVAGVGDLDFVDNVTGREDAPAPTTTAAPAPTTTAAPATTTTTEAPPALIPADPVLTASNDKIVLTGNVPDGGTSVALENAAAEQVGAGNVDNQLTIDDGYTNEGGTLTLRGNMPTQETRDATADSATAVAEGAGMSVDDGITVDFVSTINDLFSLSPIEFDTSSAVIRDGSKSTLDEAAEVLLANPGVNLEVQGHTDSRGDADSNASLSDDRANSVREYLIGKGVPAEQLTAKGYGETQLKVDPEETPQDLQDNRRIEFKRI